MKQIIKFIKKTIFAFGLLYGFNIIMGNLGMFLPLNIYTIGITALLGFPGLFLLVGLTVII